MTESSISMNNDTKFVESASNHWVRLRGIVSNMRSIFNELYVKDFKNEDHGKDVITMLDRFVEIGDKINLVKHIENSFDEDLIYFLSEKWSKAKLSILEITPALQPVLTVDAKALFLAVAKGLVKQFSQSFHQQALAHVQEQEFVIETMRQAAFTDSEILEVFELLGLPTKELIASSPTLKAEITGRSYKTQSHKKQNNDPLALIAGLGFATFAAYLIYRLISTTTAPKRRKRGAADPSIDLSDMPSVMTQFYNWIEKAERIYEAADEQVHISFGIFTIFYMIHLFAD